MTIYEFLDVLYDNPRLWELCPPDGAIMLHGFYCPWSFVDALIGSPSREGPRLHVKGVGAQRSIWRAADNRKGHNPRIRRALLDACGLSE